MQIVMRSTGFPITNALEDYVKSRIDFVLSRFTGSIQKVEVFVADENGPKGGIDKSCIVKIKMDQHRDLVIKDIQDDLYIAVARAVARAKQSLVRNLQRSRTLSRRSKTLLEDMPESSVDDNETTVAY